MGGDEYDWSIPPERPREITMSEAEVLFRRSWFASEEQWKDAAARVECAIRAARQEGIEQAAKYVDGIPVFEDESLDSVVLAAAIRTLKDGNEGKG